MAAITAGLAERRRGLASAPDRPAPAQPPIGAPCDRAKRPLLPLRRPGHRPGRSASARKVSEWTSGSSWAGSAAVDLLLFLFFAGFFVLGFAQGTIRRLIGLGVGPVLVPLRGQPRRAARAIPGPNWTPVQPASTRYIVGFADGVRRRGGRLRPRRPGLVQAAARCSRRRASSTSSWAALLGVVQAGVILGAVIVILGTFFLHPGHRRGQRRAAVHARDLGRAPDRRVIGQLLPGHAHPGLLRDLRLPRAVERSRRCSRARTADRAPDRAPAGRRRSRPPPGRSSARTSSATTRPADGSAGSSRSRRTAGPEDLASHARFGRDRPQRRHVRAGRASPTCTLSTGCTTV